MTQEEQTQRAAFEKHLHEWTGRDITYHKANGTWGLDFGWSCWLASQTQRAPESATKVLNVLAWKRSPPFLIVVDDTLGDNAVEFRDDSGCVMARFVFAAASPQSETPK